MKFLDEFDEKGSQEDFTDDTTINGRSRLLDDGIESPKNCTTEIGGNNKERRPADYGTESFPDAAVEDLDDPVSDDENDVTEEDQEVTQDRSHARGSGRP